MNQVHTHTKTPKTQTDFTWLKWQAFHLHHQIEYCCSPLLQRWQRCPLWWMVGKRQSAPGVEGHAAAACGPRCESCPPVGMTTKQFMFIFFTVIDVWKSLMWLIYSEAYLHSTYTTPYAPDNDIYCEWLPCIGKPYSFLGNTRPSWAICNSILCIGCLISIFYNITAKKKSNFGITVELKDIYRRRRILLDTLII